MATNPFDLFKNMQQLQDKMNLMRNELEKITATGSAGAGFVEITLNGKFEVVNITIDKSVIDPEDPITLQTLIASAFNTASSNIQATLQKKSMDLASGLNIQ
jgi:DNA-binding YbaB/EbfC family protein